MAIATPNVRLVAHTVIAEGFPDIDPQDGDTDADFLAEASGRNCYLAWGRKNPDTNTNRTYMAHIIESRHSSVMEHSSATFYLTGVSRACLTELSRHRFLSFSVVSQRYVDSTNANVVIPPALRDDEDATQALKNWQSTIGTVYQSMVFDLQEKGLPRKQAREAARCLMPNMTETRIVVTGNFRAWREVLGRRLDPSADAELQEVSGMILEHLKKIGPSCFQDFEEK